MTIERVTQAPHNPHEHECWMLGWCRVVEADGSTVAYCPDETTARIIVDAVRTWVRQGQEIR